MHNNIMPVGSRDRPPMLTTGRYTQWQSRFLRYIDTRPYGDALRKCILEGLYTPSTVIIPVVPATDDSPDVLEQTACKEIAKPITPPSESASKEDTDPEQAQRDKDMQKNLALIAKYFKKIYQPTNNNLRNSSNSRNNNVDTSPRAKWQEDTDEEIDEQELEAHYSYMAKIQEVSTADSGTDTKPLEKVQCDAEYNVFANERQNSEQPKSTSNTCVVEKVDSNVILNSPDMCDHDIQTSQNAEECDDERVALANLIANLTLDTKENKNILKQLKKANTSLTQELKECNSNLEESSTTDEIK
ncbi:hypothetical protein Tco_0196663 [Tanacetum coccineum]